MFPNIHSCLPCISALLPDLHQRAADPHCLLDATAWELRPAAVASQLSARNADFAVVGALGGQGLGKSSLLNKLLGESGVRGKSC